MSTAYDAARSPSLGSNYPKLWSAAAVSNLADGIFVVALPLIAVLLTTSPALVAVFVAAAVTSLAMLSFRRYLGDAELDAAEPPEVVATAHVGT